MALYDFKCETCGVMFEVERPITETGPVTCPSCGGADTSKIFSAAGIVFKGGGFYSTDKRPAGADKPSGDKPASDGGKSDADKPAAEPASDKSSGKKTADTPKSKSSD